MDTTDGHTIYAAIEITAIVRLGCGCLRLSGERPGPRFEGSCDAVALLTGCRFHDSDVGWGR